MKNVTLSVDKNVLVIRVDLSKDHGLSSTGKTHIITTQVMPGAEIGHGAADLTLGGIGPSAPDPPLDLLFITTR